MSYQVWVRDEFGRFEIQTVLNSKGLPENEWKTPEDAFVAAKRFVDDRNWSGPLTYDEQLRAVKHVLPETELGVYAGNFVMGKHRYLKDGAEHVLPRESPLRFYIGAPKGEPLYLTDPRRNPVTSFESEWMPEKATVFVRKVPTPAPYFG